MLDNKKTIIERIGLTDKDIEVWRIGEGDELKKWIGFGFYKTQFIKENGKVKIIYEDSEVRKFEEALNDHLNEKLFDEMCDRMFELIELSHEEGANLYKISIESMPLLTIFDEISKYPEWATPSMLKRLERVRKTTEDFHYKLSKNLTVVFEEKEKE